MLSDHFKRAALIAALLPGLASASDEANRLEFFEKKIRPILTNHCATCHSAETKPAGGLRVDDRNGLLTGGNNGPAVVPGEPAKSLLLQRIHEGQGKRRMPLEGEPLSEQQVGDLTAWIKDGAACPPVKVPASVGRPRAEYETLRKEHWAFQPLKSPDVPEVKDGTWPRNDVDRFLLAALESKNLPPVADADRLTLIRRLTFDLTGLPPTPEEIECFLADKSPSALESLVDRLLASPRFGERWGRHWLDVARYAESTGPSRNIPYPHAWRYRDYVIDAVNADVPFDRFIQEQTAGDLLPATSTTERDRLLTATGFLALGVKDVNQRFNVRFDMDNVDEQIDVVSRSVLGLTVSCARCHDHKFDPIPTTDYYSLAGIFTSTDNASGLRNKMGGGGLAYYNPAMLIRLSAAETPNAPNEQVAKLEAEVEEAQKAFEAIRGTEEGKKKGASGLPRQRELRLKWEKLQADLNAITDPAAKGHAVHGVRDAATTGDTELRVRGEAEKLGPKVPRGFLTTFDVPGAAKINTAQSGRLELAQWLTSPKNPLTARVAVNRVWHHLFGRGLVSTVDNFGVTGDTPSNPELLDHLANRFIANGWSVKRLVRSLVLTRAYQLGSDTTEAHLTADPANALVWRHSPRRLDAEELRDAMLQAAGNLDLARPEGTAAKTLRMVEIRDNGPEAAALREAADASFARSVYLPLLRGVTPRALEAFDPVEQTLVTGSRDATTVPSQALFLLNSSFVRQQSLAVAEKVLSDSTLDDPTRVQQAYLQILGRPATDTEVARARGFLGEYESAAREAVASADATPSQTPEMSEAPATPQAPIIDPDQADQGGVAVKDEVVQPRDARTAAWLAFTQALFGSAEFRFTK